MPRVSKTKTARAAKTFRPARLSQCSLALRLGPELLKEFRHRQPRLELDSIHRHRTTLRLVSEPTLRFGLAHHVSLRRIVSNQVIPYTHPWGWATWSSRWKRFIIDPDITRKFIESVFFRKQFNFNGLNNYSLMLKFANSGSIDSWYIYWYLFVLLNRGVSVFPPRTYINNMGDVGTHSSKINPLKYVLKNKKLLDKVVRIPDSTEINTLL